MYALRLVTASLFFLSATASATEAPQHLLVEASSTPLFASPQSLTFQEMLVHVYRTSPKIQVERENVRIADEKVSQANAGFRPSVSANADTGRARENVDGQKWIYGEANNLSLDAVQPLFNGFGTIEEKAAAKARVLAARSRLLAVEQTVLLTAIADWLEIGEKEKLLALNAENKQKMMQYADNARHLFQAGEGTKTDIAQSESRMAQAEIRYAMVKAERESAYATLQRDTGLLLEKPIDFPSLPADLPASRQQAVEMAEHNPQIEQLLQENQAATHDVEVAKSSLYPNLSLRASIGEDNAPELGLQRQRNDSITLHLSIPLYQGGGEYSRIREANLRKDKTEMEGQDVAMGVLLNVRTAWNNYDAAKSVISASQKSSEAAMQALAGVQEEHRQGLRSMTDVLQEQLEILGSQITTVQAEKNLRLEAYRLLAAVGKLDEKGLHLEDEPYDTNLHYNEVVPKWVGY